MRNLLITVLLIKTMLVFGQNETVNIKFAEAMPLWTHTLVDSTFEEISGQLYWTKYSSLGIGPTLRFNDTFYLLSSSYEPGAILDDWGFVLDKIDFKTGELMWKHHNTMYKDGNQDYYHEIKIRDDGNIELLGVERFGPNQGLKNWTFGAFHSNSIRKVINRNDGVLNDLYRAKDSIIEIRLPCRHYMQYPIIDDSLYLTAVMVGNNIGDPGNPVYTYGITFQLLDKHMNIINQSRNLFDFDLLGPFSIDQPSFIRRLNDNSLISIAYKDRLESWDNNGLQMMWSDISDPLNIKTKQIVDFTNIVPGTKYRFNTHRFKTLNNTIFLGHNYPNFDIQSNSAYILWLDKDGEIKTFIDLPYHNDHLYQFTDISYANENFAYLFAYPSSTGREGYDIVRIEKGVDTIKFVSSITAKNQGEEFGIDVSTIFEDGYVIFGGVVKKEGENTKLSTKYFCFKAEDLGITFEPVLTTEIENNRKSQILYPNPTSGRITVGSVARDMEIEVFNLTGQKVKKYKSPNNTFDISDLPQGMYIILIQCEKLIERHKVIKVD